MNTCTLPPSSPSTQGVPAFSQENLTRVYQFVYVQVRNREVAEDLTSQVFLKAVRHLDEQRSSQSIRSWLFQVAHTTIMDYWRMVKRAPAASLDFLLDAGRDFPNGDDAPGMNNSSAERVQDILQQLPERYREVLVYRFLLNYTVSEAALMMGVTEANVKVLQFRALKKAAALETATTGNDSSQDEVVGG
ncbi:MAG TPA: sigma-70 family RNA polymerase sigma factor [Ktedonobacteraceae bacterium]|nr:sigma-70 family RNA polymerase sigma factor [Ktedonobacteraceae bacterium]